MTVSASFGVYAIWVRKQTMFPTRVCALTTIGAVEGSATDAPEPTFRRVPVRSYV